MNTTCPHNVCGAEIGENCECTVKRVNKKLLALQDAVKELADEWTDEGGLSNHFANELLAKLREQEQDCQKEKENEHE